MAKALEQNTLSKQSLVAPTSKQVASKGYQWHIEQATNKISYQGSMMYVYYKLVESNANINTLLQQDHS
jgi:hypothetical protein